MMEPKRNKAANEDIPTAEHDLAEKARRLHSCLE